MEANPSTSALLELEDVHKSFGSVVVADGLTVRVSPGETLGIVGPNGAGKTSVLNLISGALPLDRGRILVDGIDISRMPVHSRARLGIGRTYQIPRPFGGMTVFENVLLGALAAGRSRREGSDPVGQSASALEVTGLIGKANVMAGTLPLLDRKRLELARAIAIHPRILLLDEIAGGLTEAEVERLVETVLSLKAGGLTVVWIEHIVAALLSVVDRLIAMDDGRNPQ